LGSVSRGSHAHLYLRTALERSLASEPHPSTSLLSEVQDAHSPVVARFEHGDESLEQKLAQTAYSERPLPLPFLWTVQVVAEAAAALDYHHQGGISSALGLGPRGIILLKGRTRLNAAILEPRAKLATVGEPNKLSLAATLAFCLAGADATRRLGLTRPLLPAALIQFVDGAPTRHESTWQREFGLLKQQQRRLQGRHWPSSVPARHSQSELCLHQLSLLPALLRLAGQSAVDAFFARCAECATPRVEQFRVAFDSWRRERRLHERPPLVESATLERARADDEVASQARVHQARLEFERRDPLVALSFAIDAVRAAPGSFEAWLLLGEIRRSTCSGSQALCLSEAICASRGEARVIERVLRQLGMQDQQRLAAYFRVHGDCAVADFLDPPPRWRVTSRLQH
jgi:hypothetical protein